MDIAAANWNQADNSNTAASPDGLPENCAPSGVNNWARATMGAIKRFWKRSSVIVTTGSSSAYLVTHTVPPAALADGECELIQFHAANTAGATLNVGGLGAVPLHYYAAGAWRLIPNDLWGADFTSRVAYNAAAAAYRLLDLPDRTGEVVTFAGATVPHGSLLCYGQAISRTAYAGLFVALGTAHGVGDGTATFNLPDMRGQVGAGMSNMGGSDAGNLTGGATLGAGLGVQSTSTTGNASINGPTQGPNNVTGTNNGATGDFATGIHAHNISLNAPVTTAFFSVVQPTRVLNYIIRV
jgi:microcystin-dependent protein